jgi:hypothetical protein
MKFMKPRAMIPYDPFIVNEPGLMYRWADVTRFNECTWLARS